MLFTPHSEAKNFDAAASPAADNRRLPALPIKPALPYPQREKAV